MTRFKSMTDEEVAELLDLAIGTMTWFRSQH